MVYAEAETHRVIRGTEGFEAWTDIRFSSACDLRKRDQVWIETYDGTSIKGLVYEVRPRAKRVELLHVSIFLIKGEKKRRFSFDEIESIKRRDRVYKCKKCENFFMKPAREGGFNWCGRC